MESLSALTTWAKENPWKAAGIGLGVVAIGALAFSSKARQAVGLGRVPARKRRTKTSKTTKKVLRLK